MVWYDDDTWSSIYNQLKTDLNSFDEITRAQFIIDNFYLMKLMNCTFLAE